MSFSDSVWRQVKNKSADNIISALLKDGFALDTDVRAERVYRHHDGRRVSIHYHTGNRSYGPKLLKELLKDIGWDENDMRRLKFIK